MPSSDLPETEHILDFVELCRDEGLRVISDCTGLSMYRVRVGTEQLLSARMTKAISVQCTAVSKQTGKQCKAQFVAGGGAAGQVKAKAAVRAELLRIEIPHR
jgi:hypothetical protein